MSQDPIPKPKPIIKHKKGGMETLLIIFLVLLLIGVVIGGAGLVGIIHIPGITPAKKDAPHPVEVVKTKAPLASLPHKKLPKAVQKPTPLKPIHPAALPSAPHPIPIAPPTLAPAISLPHPVPPHPAPPSVPKTDPTRGAKKIATLWDQITTKELVVIVKNWNNLELAEVIMQMSPSKASALLEALDPKRASRISKIIQQEGSMISHP